MNDIKQRLLRLTQIKFVRDSAILQVGNAVTIASLVLTSVVVVRGLDSGAFGVYRLAVALYGTLVALDLTGLGLSTIVRLASALAIEDPAETLGLLAYYIKVSAAVAVGMLALAFALGPPVATWLYGDPEVGELARWLALLFVLDAPQLMVRCVLQSGRHMARLTTLTTLSALASLGLVTAAVFGGRGPGGVIAARLAASALLSAYAVAYYARVRSRLNPALPGWGAVMRRAAGVPVRRYWGFGFGIALDKNISNLFTLLPLQVLGSLHGAEVAGFLSLAQSAVSIPSSMFDTVMHNLGVRLPQDRGRGDYAAMWRNYARVTATLAAGGVVIFGVFALVAPWLVPFLYEEKSLPTVPLVGVMSVYGAIAAAGGSVSALYRTLERVRWALAAKVAALVLIAVPGYWLIREHAAPGAAWTTTALLAVSTAATAALVLPYLRRLATRAAVPGRAPEDEEQAGA